MDDEMVERVARALYPNVWGLSDLGVTLDIHNQASKDYSIAQARAAIEEYERPVA